MKKSRFAGVSATVLALVAVTGCSTAPSSSPADGEQTITFLHPLSNAFTEAIAAFEEAHPNISVNEQAVPFDEMIAQTQARLGSGDTSIDVIAVDPPRLPSMAHAGWLEDVSDVKSSMDAVITENGIASVTWGGKQWAYPVWTGDNFLFYNRALLEEAGVSEPESAPDGRLTWQQLVDDATAVQASGAAQFGFGFDQVDRYYALQSIAMSLGAGTGLDGKDNLTADVTTPQWQEFADWYASIHKSGLAPVGIDPAQMPDLFTSGKVAYLVGAPTRIGVFQESGLKDGWGVAPLPYWEGGDIVTPTDSFSLGVSAYSTKKDAARMFTEFISLTPEGSSAASAIYNLFPVNKDALPVFVERVNGLAADVGTTIESIFEVDSEYAVRRPGSIGYVDFETSMNKAFADIRNGADPAGALASSEKQLNSDLGRFR